MNNDKNSYFNTIKQNRIKGFRKSFDKLREKLKSLKGNSLIEENTKETETLNDPFYTEDSKIDLPKIKKNILADYIKPLLKIKNLILKWMRQRN